MDSRVQLASSPNGGQVFVFQSRTTDRAIMKLPRSRMKHQVVGDSPRPNASSPTPPPTLQVVATAVPSRPSPFIGANGDQQKRIDDKERAPVFYTPEAAFTKGKIILDWINNVLGTLNITSKLRNEVWKKELDDLSSQTTPRTLIAICGTTGSGKSSVINALLDDTIVPTSGMRACTAVVTEISYKPGPSIDADVSFLTRDEWRDELRILIDDLTENNGGLKKVADSRGDETSVSLSKVHALYPNLPQAELIHLTPDEVINRYPTVACYLDSTRKIEAGNSSEFAKAIGRYIDSKETKGRKRHDGKKKSDEPALWPLIRTVKIRCSAKVLETGAVLVDLPGTADTNAARSRIAEQYMQRCMFIWILAPITRAVSDKLAKDLLGAAFRTQLLMDGNYDASAVTFIATKTDDLACTEIVSGLNLEDEETLARIEDQIHEQRREEKRQKKAKTTADAEAKELDREYKAKYAVALECQAGIRALDSGESFSPRWVQTTGATVTLKSSRNNDGFRDNYAASDSDSDDDSVSTSEDDYGTASDGSDRSDAEGEDVDDVRAQETRLRSEKITVDTLKQELQTAEEAMLELKRNLEIKNVAAQVASKRAMKAKDRVNQLQREKNGFCSQARNEYSRMKLQEDWRLGIKEMDEDVAMRRDPQNFDPSQRIRDYSAIHLPVFTVSSRDYIRITKQVKGDGPPTCFTDVQHTEIPQLQAWCRTLTVASRERSARAFLTRLKNFLEVIKSYVDGMEIVSEIDRAALRQRWSSERSENSVQIVNANTVYNQRDGLYADLRYLESGPGFIRESLPPVFRNHSGVTPTLIQKFDIIVEQVKKDLRDIFRHGLQEKLSLGSDEAAKAARPTSVMFADSMHWQTYRATLRRDGAWYRGDLNALLSEPMTATIAQSWAKVFEKDLFGDFEQQALKVVQRLVDEVERDAPAGLSERARAQGKLAIEDTKATMKEMVKVVNEALQDAQKDTSRSISPYVKAKMRPGYQSALQEHGPGSVARQQNQMHQYVYDIRFALFEGTSQELMNRLSESAETVGRSLKRSLDQLASKVEVDMSALWENVNVADPQHIAARRRAVVTIQQLVELLDLWVTAERQNRSQQVLSISNLGARVLAHPVQTTSLSMLGSRLSLQS